MQIYGVGKRLVEGDYVEQNQWGLVKTAINICLHSFSVSCSVILVKVYPKYLSNVHKLYDIAD